MNQSLAELAGKYGTDKLDHGYCPIYESLFADLRDVPVLLVELGVWEGASLRMWAEYFTNPDSDLLGIDREPPPSAFNDPRVRVYRSDQAEIPSALADLPLDIVIDDASHISSKTIDAFKAWFPLVKPGGLYVVEDLMTSYYDDSVHSGFEGHPDPDFRGFTTAMQFCKRLADETNGWMLADYRWGYPIASVSFHPNMCVVRKA